MVFGRAAALNCTRAVPHACVSIRGNVSNNDHGIAAIARKPSRLFGCRMGGFQDH